MAQPASQPATESMPLPPARDPAGPYRIALVCLGNICRSPIAEFVLVKALTGAGLDGRVVVQSSGTGDWHIGQPMDRRAARTLREAGYDGSAHRAQRFTHEWFAGHDLILAMDHSNYRDIVSTIEFGFAGEPAVLGDIESRVRMFRDFDPEADAADLEVPDPYYDGDDGFSVVLSIVERTAHELAGRLAEAGIPGSAETTTELPEG